MSAEPDTFQPPYMSWATFDSIIEQFRGSGLPEQIDRSVLSSRSGGDQSQFLRAAAAFGLVDANGAPTDRLKTYVSDPESRAAIMREILHEKYPNVVALSINATPLQLTEQFRTFGIDGDTVRKAQAFYLSAARMAEIPLSPHFKATRPGAGGRRSVKRAAAKKVTEDSLSQTPLTPDPVPQLHPAILTLVQSLPPAKLGEKAVFPEADRGAWFAYATATFNLIYSLSEDDTAVG